jgi:RTX calcium-binding nonapeptide repeat (4 copies)
MIASASAPFDRRCKDLTGLSRTESGRTRLPKPQSPPSPTPLHLGVHERDKRLDVAISHGLVCLADSLHKIMVDASARARAGERGLDPMSNLIRADDSASVDRRQKRLMRAPLLIFAFICSLMLPTTGAAQDVVRCDGHRATIVGTEGKDLLVGTPGRDLIQALGGNDTIRALRGNDSICGGVGRDVIYAGPGRDRILDRNPIVAQNGADRITAGRGRDQVSAGGGDDVIQAGPGGDDVNDLGGDDVVYLGPGRDFLSAFAPSPGNDIVHMGSGTDGAIDGAGDDSYMGGPGHDALTLGRGGSDVFLGGSGSDTLSLGEAPTGPTFIDLSTNEIQGDGIDSDTIGDIENLDGTALMPTFDDIFIGNDEDNFFHGNGGDDHLEGRAGDDRLLGGTGVDFLDGGTGTDECLDGETVLNCEA